MESARRVTTFRLDPELLEGMQIVWERDGVLPSEQVRRALHDWLVSKGVKLKTVTRRAPTRRKT